MPQLFSKKWEELKKRGTEDNREERSIFVPEGFTPVTQRQLNLYYYFRFIKNILDRTKAREVLEAGCGRGTISLYLKTRMNLSLTLLDNVPEAIDLAKEEFAKHGRSASFFIEDVLHTHFPEESFDAIVSIGLAEHFPPRDVGLLFAEQFRVLRKGGVMISMNIPKKFSIQSLNTLMRFFKKIFGRYNENVKKDYFRNDLSPRQYKALARKAGFKHVSTTHVCPFPLFVPVARTTDRKLTTLYKFILAVREPFMRYPYKTNGLFAQAHFLVAYKK